MRKFNIIYDRIRDVLDNYVEALNNRNLGDNSTTFFYYTFNVTTRPANGPYEAMQSLVSPRIGIDIQIAINGHTFLRNETLYDIVESMSILSKVSPTEAVGIFKLNMIERFEKQFHSILMNSLLESTKVYPTVLYAQRNQYSSTNENYVLLKDLCQYVDETTRQGKGKVRPNKF